MFVLTRPASNSLDLFSDISPFLLSFFPPFNFWKKKAVVAFVYHGLDTGPSWAVLHTSTLTCPPVISRFLHLPLISPWLCSGRFLLLEYISAFSLPPAKSYLNFKTQLKQLAISHPKADFWCPHIWHSHCPPEIVLWWHVGNYYSTSAPPHLIYFLFEEQRFCLSSHYLQQPAESRTWWGPSRYSSLHSKLSSKCFYFLVGESLQRQAHQ